MAIISSQAAFSLSFNSIDFKLKWVRMPQKCLKMLFMATEAKFELP